MTASKKIREAQRIVVKIGSVLVTEGETGTPRKEWLSSIAEDIRALQEAGKEVVIVSSGAIALGRKKLGINVQTPSSAISLDKKQAAAAIGQINLLQAYYEAFTGNIAQILLTPEDTENRRSHLNARSTVLALLEAGVVPVINENDSTATAEIRFGDNDRLAARVAQMIGADLLILLSTIDGLYTADPKTDSKATHIPEVKELKEDILAMGQDVASGISTGGMKSKLEAARLATTAGTNMIIADGQDLSPLAAINEGAQATVFHASDKPSNARKRWISSHINPRGSVTIDDGAVKALLDGKSLLPVGVTKVEGNFERGDVIKILDNNNNKLGVGLSAYSSRDMHYILNQSDKTAHRLQAYLGREELVHRNDLVLY